MNQYVTDNVDLSVTDKLHEEDLRRASKPLGDTLLQTDFVVPNMHCVSCISSIERNLGSLEYVKKVRANLSTRRVAVVWDAAKGQGGQLGKTITGLGFENSLFTGEDQAEKAVAHSSKPLIMSLAVAGFAAANIMLLSVAVWSGADQQTAQLFNLIAGLIAVPAVAFAGRPFFASALRSLKVGRLNMDVPISLAVVLALALGIYESLTGGHETYFDASVMLLFFLLIGRTLDQIMREKARSAVQSLARLNSKGGIVVTDDGSLEFVDQAQIKINMRVRVLPGERFPVDGKIIEGISDVDRSLVTGESMPVVVNSGDHIEAGTLNLTGSVDIITTSDASNSFLAEIISMMSAAENGRGRYVRVAERMANIYAPAVHLLALSTFIGWMLATGDWKSSIYAAISVLIITCPCALGLAVPVVHVIGANRLFKEGILMRDGSAFERLAEIDTVVFDKTGTLTQGQMRVVGETDTDETSANLIATLANRSSHPASAALSDYFHNAKPMDITDLVESPGYGVQAKWGGKIIRLGRPSWVAELGSNTATSSLEGSVAFAIEQFSQNNFHLSDNLRPDTEGAVDLLKQAKLDVEILSGDRHITVAGLASDLAIENYRAEMTPKNKIDHLHKLERDKHKVLMVGDGINDAPSIAAAHVSMAPSSASEIGRLASDFVFTRGSLLAIPFAHRIAQRTGQLVRQNFAAALIYNCLAVPMAMAGYVTPLVAALAMSTSSIIVVANSLRLTIGDGIDHAGETDNQLHVSTDAAQTVAP